MMDYADKMQKCNEYIEALEVERRKIQVFQRELPLCLELVSQAIDACRQQLSSSSSPAAAGVGTSHECFHVRQQQSECSEQTSSHGPVLEEFIPIKRVASCSSEDVADDEEEEEDESGEKSGKKSDWLRSVQLWNQSPDPAPVSEMKKNGGAFRPYDKEKVVAAEEMADRRPVENKPASSTTVKSRKEESNSEKESGQTQRKQRRCWSPELHRRFIHSLQQLGGPHVATPKQIKELMKVDGLTNDEVKSHLQKYRLHMRRPSAAMPSSSNAQGPQFVVVGGIWVPPPECPAAVATAATATSSGDQGKAKSGKNEARTPSNGVYAPVATVGTPFVRPASKTQKNRQKGHHCEEEGSHSTQGGGARAHSSSPASSSSTHTTAIAAASPESS